MVLEVVIAVCMLSILVFAYGGRGFISLFIVATLVSVGWVLAGWIGAILGFGLGYVAMYSPGRRRKS